MPVLHIVLEPDGAFARLQKRPHIRVDEFAITALEGGMKSGQPSVAFVIEPPDGPWIFAETSLKLLLTAVDAIKAKYGDPRIEAGGPTA